MMNHLFTVGNLLMMDVINVVDVKVVNLTILFLIKRKGEEYKNFFQEDRTEDRNSKKKNSLMVVGKWRALKLLGTVQRKIKMSISLIRRETVSKRERKKFVIVYTKSSYGKTDFGDKNDQSTD